MSYDFMQVISPPSTLSLLVYATNVQTLVQNPLQKSPPITLRWSIYSPTSKRELWENSTTFLGKFRIIFGLVRIRELWPRIFSIATLIFWQILLLD